MMNQDRLIIETYEKKNELESLIYSWKERLTTGPHREYAKPEEIPQIIQFLEGENEWLYADGQNSNRGTYNERINNVKSKVAHILKRYDAFEHINNDAVHLNDALSAATNTLNSLVHFDLFRIRSTSTSLLRNGKKDSI